MHGWFLCYLSVLRFVKFAFEVLEMKCVFDHSL
jgi:hypothetical protein